MQIFLKVSVDFINCNVERGQQWKKMCCPVGFLEELITVFQVTMSQIDTENDKNPKIFQFPKFLPIFC